MHVRLVVIEPDVEPSQYRLELPLVIGRGGDVQLKLDHALVSRRHCELAEHEGRVLVRDLGSRNGTFVGGKRIDVGLAPSGELLTVGAHTFRVIYRDTAPPVAYEGAIDETAWAVSTRSGEDTLQGPVKGVEQGTDEPDSDDDTEDLRRMS